MEEEISKPLALGEKTHFFHFGLRLGKIAFNVAILLVLIAVCGALSLMTTAFLILFAIIVTILSLGTIFKLAPNFWPNIISGAEFTGDVSTFLLNNAYIFLSIAIAFSVFSIVVLALDRKQKHIARIVFASLTLLTAVILMILFGAGVIA